MSQTVQNGGAFGRTRHQKLKEKYPEYFYIMKHCMASEKNLISSLKKYSNATNDFYSKYYTHMDNLIRLDQMFEGFDSFRRSFEIVFGEFKDKKKISEQSLLLSNYNKLQPFAQPEDIIKNHLIQQVIYLLANHYNSNERLLIKQVLINDVQKKPTIVIVTSDGKSTNPSNLPHNKYHIDYVKLGDLFDQAIMHMRSTLDLAPAHKLGEPRMVDDIKFDPRTMPTVKFNDPQPMKPLKENPAVKRLSMKKYSNKKPSNHKGSNKKHIEIKKVEPKVEPKVEHKKDEKKVEPKVETKVEHKKEEKKVEHKKDEKKINEITIPGNQANLPILKMDIPQKK